MRLRLRSARFMRPRLRSVGMTPVDAPAPALSRDDPGLCRPLVAIFEVGLHVVRAPGRAQVAAPRALLVADRAQLPDAEGRVVPGAQRKGRERLLVLARLGPDG